MLDEIAGEGLEHDVRGEIEHHLESCGGCRRAREQLDDLLARIAALPRSVPPRRDLWDGVAARIEERKLVRGPFPASEATPFWMRPRLLAAAAAVLIIASSGLTALFLGRGSTAPGPAAAAPAGLAAQSNVAATVAWQEFTAAEEQYRRVTSDLLGALEARRHELAPETVRVVEENLEIIDGAIREARDALQRDPANAGLANKLTGIYRKKADFLRAMSRL